jgi:8-oxo-dGTP pyrophosphatase MutT (NUDIX family)
MSSETTILLAMTKEYKIHFGNRKIVLTNNLKDNVINHFGYYVSYGSPNEFTNLLQFFQNLTSTDSLYIVGANPAEMFTEFSSLFKTIEAAGGLVHNDKDEFLLIKRHGLWDLPKGKEEKGEKPEVTALREVSEECGIKKIVLEDPIAETYHTYELNGNLVLKKTYWFKMYYNGNGSFTPQIKEDITEVKWVHKNELGEYLKNTYQSIHEVFQSVGLY